MGGDRELDHRSLDSGRGERHYAGQSCRDEEERRSRHPALLGVPRGYGQYLALDDAWAPRVIEAVGNYGETFERDLGSASVMKMARGANNLWTQGGLMYALPIRR